MLFAMSLALITIALAALGLSFEDALVLAIAMLSTTGPIVTVASDSALVVAEFPASVKLVLCGAMVLGRIEALAIIALISPNLWRD